MKIITSVLSSLVSSLLFIATSPSFAAEAAPLSEDWKVYAHAENVIALENLKETAKKANKRIAGSKLDAESAENLRQLEALAAETNLPVDEKNLLGNWRCRSTQPGEELIVRYTYFKCTIKRTEKGLFLEKTSGSQRISGYLFKNKNDEYVFLGGASVNDDPLADFSGFKKLKQQDQDVTGLMFRKSAGLVLLTTISDPEMYEALEFKK